MAQGYGISRYDFPLDDHSDAYPHDLGCIYEVLFF